jgi:hypothetical protein
MKKISSKKILLWAVIGGFVLGGMITASLTWIIFCIGGILYWYTYQSERKLKKQVAVETLKDKAREFVEEVKKNKKLQQIRTSAFLERGEHAFLEEDSALFETRAVRESTGAGVGFRVMKGVSVGGYKSRSESHQEMRALDTGVITITNQKLIFRGMKENRVIPLSSIVGMKVYSDAIEIASTGRQKGSSFSVSNPYMWNVIFYILRNVENPLDFSAIQNIDIRIE